jgi:hypothetical protein
MLESRRASRSHTISTPPGRSLGVIQPSRARESIRTTDRRASRDRFGEETLGSELLMLKQPRQFGRLKTTVLRRHGPDRPWYGLVQCQPRHPILHQWTCTQSPPKQHADAFTSQLQAAMAFAR